MFSFLIFGGFDVSSFVNYSLERRSDQDVSLVLLTHTFLGIELLLNFAFSRLLCFVFRLQSTCLVVSQAGYVTVVL